MKLPLNPTVPQICQTLSMAGLPAPLSPPRRMRRLPIVVCGALALSACQLAPVYQVPETPHPAAFKEAPQAGATWYPAAPADALERGPWWELFGDPTLSALVAQVEVSNQNVAMAVAAYAQAQALVSEQRASLFPSVSLSGSGKRTGGGASLNGGGDTFQLGANASWAPDVWGQLRDSLGSAEVNAQASAANLAAARLSAQTALASDYFALRDADNQIRLLGEAVKAYERSLRITQNQYDAGIAARTDVLQAQTQLESTRASLSAQVGQRAQLEHAMALLLGRAPAEFSLPAAPWNMAIAAVPTVVPSALLQRRPDIAAAERAVAAANLQIGIQRAGYFPVLGLTGSLGRSGSTVADLFRASNNLWSLGVSAAQTLFDAGATSARVDAARAAHASAVASYRQVVLTAFQSVEDQLATSHALAEQAEQRRAASAAADLAEQQMLNQYLQGQVPYTSVVATQVTALSARQTLSQLAASRQSNAVALIQSLGGGWHASTAAAPPP